MSFLGLSGIDYKTELSPLCALFRQVWFRPTDQPWTFGGYLWSCKPTKLASANCDRLHVFPGGNCPSNDVMIPRQVKNLGPGRWHSLWENQWGDLPGTATLSFVAYFYGSDAAVSIIDDIANGGAAQPLLAKGVIFQ